jgi:hypothetical protein
LIPRFKGIVILDYFDEGGEEVLLLQFYARSADCFGSEI